jgi:hypothetical protein
MIPTSLLRRVISQSPDLSLSPAIEFQRQDATPCPNRLLAVQRPPFILRHNMRTQSRSNGKAGLSENNSGGVTILQWLKRFGATLGFPPLPCAERLLKRPAQQTGTCLN